MSKHILIFVSFANLAGAQIASLRLAKGLRDRGYDPSVYFLYEQVPVDTPDHPYEVLLKKASPGIKGYLQIICRLWNLIRREKPDVVLTFLPLANVLGQALAFLAGIKKRIISHRMPANTAKPVMRKLDDLWASLGIYTRVIAVSHGVMNSIRHYPQKLLAKTSVVHNGLLGWKPSALSRQEARARLNIPDNMLALVAVGRFVPQKHYPLMLRLMEKLDNTLLLIAGDGFLRKEIEAQIDAANLHSKVRLLGNVSRPDIPDLLAAADLFIQTSLYEGQSNSVLESLHAGVPLVVHEVPEQRETIADDHQVAGALVPLEDQAAWIAAIENFRDHPDQLERARLFAKERAKVFTYEAMIDGFVKAIETPN